MAYLGWSATPGDWSTRHIRWADTHEKARPGPTPQRARDAETAAYKAAAAAAGVDLDAWARTWRLTNPKYKESLADRTLLPNNNPQSQPQGQPQAKDTPQDLAAARACVGPGLVDKLDKWLSLGMSTEQMHPLALKAWHNCGPAARKRLEGVVLLHGKVPKKGQSRARLAAVLVLGEVELDSSSFLTAELLSMPLAAVSLLRAIGRVVSPEDMYAPARMRLHYAKDGTTLDRVEASYGSRLADRELSDAQKARALMQFAVLVKHRTLDPERGNALLRIDRRNTQLLDAVYRHAERRPADTAGCPKHAFQMTQLQYVESMLNLKTLPFDRISEVLGVWEAHSAGCVRCLRPFWEPEWIFTLDNRRTQLLNELRGPGAIRTQKRPAFALPSAPATGIHVVGPDLVFAGPENGLVPLPARVLADDEAEDYPENTVYALVRQRPRAEPLLEVYVRNANPNEPSLHMVKRWTKPRGDEDSEEGVSGALDVYRARTLLRELDAGGGDPLKIRLSRYNSWRAQSNVCIECASLLRAKAVDMLEMVRPTELVLRGAALKRAQKTIVDRDLTRLLHYVDDDARAMQGRAADGAKYERLGLPPGYAQWARGWKQKHKGPPPPIDAAALLRMGKITEHQYGELLFTQAAPPDETKCAIDISVGDAVSGLLNPQHDARTASQAHLRVVEQIDSLLSGVAPSELSMDLQAALREVRNKHNQLCMRLDGHQAFSGWKALAADEEPQYEFQRVVFFTKTQWRAGVPVSDARKAWSARQARSVQQTKLMATMALHRRATSNEAHNHHILTKMAQSAEALFGSPLHMARLFKFGLRWQADHWTSWAPRKVGGSTTGVGHYRDPQPQLTKADYARAIEEGQLDGDPDAIKKFVTKAGAPYTLADIDRGEHPYKDHVLGPIFLPDEYESDVYAEVVKGVKGVMGCEIGPTAKLFHFHLLLDVKHISKIQLDQRALQEFFLGCWTGLLFDGRYKMYDAAGRDFVGPQERPHMQCELLPEDQFMVAIMAYIKKDSLGFRNAALRAQREIQNKVADGAVHRPQAALASMAPPPDMLVAAGDNLPGIPRNWEIHNLPPGMVYAPDTVATDAVTVRLGGPTKQQLGGTQRPTDYELGIQWNTYDNATKLHELGIGEKPSAPAHPRPGQPKQKPAPPSKILQNYGKGMWAFKDPVGLAEWAAEYAEFAENRQHEVAVAPDFLYTDVVTLKPDGWLTDTVITRYFDLLQPGSKWRLYDATLSQRKAALKRGLGSRSIVALHAPGHWAVATVQISGSTADCAVYDSMADGSWHEPLLRQMLLGAKISAGGTVAGVRYTRGAMALQTDGSSCGVAVCMAARCLSRDLPLQFDSADIGDPRNRRRILYEIVTGQLLRRRGEQ